MDIDYIIERRKELCALSPSPNAETSLSLSGKATRFALLFYPFGWNSDAIVVYSTSIDGAFEEATNKWLEIAEERTLRRATDMAQFIAKHLVTHNVVTDVHLRDGGFADKEITSLGERACALAAEAANKHPITITKIEGANGAPVQENVNDY